MEMHASLIRPIHLKLVLLQKKKATNYTKTTKKQHLCQTLKSSLFKVIFFPFCTSDPVNTITQKM